MESPELSNTGEKRPPPVNETSELARRAQELALRVAQLENDVAARTQSQAEMRAALEDAAAERERLLHRAAENARVLETVRQQFRDATAQRESLKAEWAALEATTAWKLTAMIRGVQRFFFRQKRSLSKRWRDAAHRVLRRAVAWHPTKSLRELHESAGLVRASGLLDEKWYKTEYADCVGGKTDLVLHYLRHGVTQGCDPNLYFDTRWYLERNSDAAAGMNPLVHYLTAGWKEGRDPGPIFSIAAYLRENPAVSAAGREPLADYLARRRENPALPPHPPDAATALAPAPRPGHACLAEVPAGPRICFIGHDADAEFLDLVRWLKTNTNLDFRVVLLSDGPLSPQFVEVAPLLIAKNSADADAFAAELLNFCDQRIDLIYGNTEVTALGIPILKAMPNFEAPRIVSAIRSVLAAAKRDRFSKTP